MLICLANFSIWKSFFFFSGFQSWVTHNAKHMLSLFWKMYRCQIFSEQLLKWTFHLLSISLRYHEVIRLFGLQGIPCKNFMFTLNSIFEHGQKRLQFDGPIDWMCNDKLSISPLMSTVTASLDEIIHLPHLSNCLKSKMLILVITRFSLMSFKTH